MSRTTSIDDQNSGVLPNFADCVRSRDGSQATKLNVRRRRIREVIDSADRTEAAILVAEARASDGIVPIAAVSIYCTGDSFMSDYHPFIDVVEANGRFYLNFFHFKELNALMLNGCSHRELKNVGKKYVKKKKKLSYTKDEVTITHSGNADRVGQEWYYRKQIEGVRRYFILGASRAAAHKMAKRIKADVEARLPLLELLRKYKSDSPEIEQLEKSESLSAQLSQQIDGDSNTNRIQRTGTKPTPMKSQVSIMQLVIAYQEGSENRTNGLNSKNARRCINQLRKVITLGLKLKLPKNKTKKEVQAAEKRAFERPISDLTPEIVDVFMDTMLGVGGDYEDIDELEVVERSESANSTFRQAKSIFSAKGQKIFRRAGLVFDPPSQFLAEGFLQVTYGRYSLPEFYRIEGIFEELLALKRSNANRYLARLIGLYVNLRPSEIICLRKDQIQDAGYWRVEIKVRRDFKPKHYHERSIKIPAGLANEILEVCRNNGSDYVLSDDERLEIFRQINPDLRKKFLPEAKRPSYELRKFYASASNLALGLKITHKRMGHKNSITTENHYIDKDTPKELVDLYEKYAKKLFKDAAFVE